MVHARAAVETLAALMINFSTRSARGSALEVKSMDAMNGDGAGRADGLSSLGCVLEIEVGTARNALSTASVDDKKRKLEFNDMRKLNCAECKKSARECWEGKASLHWLGDQEGWK